MNEKFDALINKLGDMADTFINEFQENPVRTTIKVLVLIYVFKKAKQLLREIR